MPRTGSPTAPPDALREALIAAHGACGRVRKVRTLFPVGRMRVHLDRVEELAISSEAVLREGEPVDAGMAEAHSLMARLGGEHGALIEGAYVNLPTGGQAARTGTGA